MGARRGVKRLLSVVVLLAACSKESTTAPASCGDDQELSGTTCIARVPACSGRMVAAEGACVPVGVASTDCADGFTWDDGKGACLPTLPAETCASGTMAVPGDSACRPVSPCGTARFPDVSGDVAYVDQSAAPGGDGTVDKPFTTISDAISKTASATIAVAAGRYQELVSFTHGRKVIGVCPDKVEIAAPSGSPWSVAMQYGGTLSKVAVTAESIGVSVCEGTIVIDKVWVHDTGHHGIEVAICPTETALVVTDSLIERATDEGIIGTLGTGTVTRTAVRDTKTAVVEKGVGVWWQWDKRAKGDQTLTVQNSLVERNITAGIYATSVPLVVDGVVARGNRPFMGARNGRGVLAGQLTGGPIEKVTVKRSYFFDNLGEAISVGQSEVELEGVTVAATRAGFGVGGGGSVILREGAHGTATRLTFYDNDAINVALAGGVLALRDSVMSGGKDIGISAQPFLTPTDPLVDSSLELTHVLVDGGAFGGVVVVGLPAVGRGVTVRNIRARDGNYGDGIAATFIPMGPAASLDLEDVVVESSARAGLGMFGADLTLHRSRLSCNAFDLDVEQNGGLGDVRTGKIVDAGDSACGCGGLGPCLASSSGLAPIGVN